MRRRHVAVGLFLLCLLAPFAAASARAAPAPAPPAPFDPWDPWEPMNRYTYRFNAELDRWVLLPVARAYVFAIPRPVRSGVSGFFDNIDEVPTFANTVLQGDVDAAAVTLTRFVVNSTLGLLGIFDVASRLDLPAQSEDFGQTLGVWGLPPGPYLVLPLFGPSSLRDGIGLAADRTLLWGAQTIVLGDFQLVLTGAFPLETVDTRSRAPIRYGQLGPFEYDLVRTIYLDYRAALIER